MRKQGERYIMSLMLVVLLNRTELANAAWYDNVLPHFQYVYETKSVKVASDISQTFSETHAKHALLVWNYFKSVFHNSPGEFVEIYYTKDQVYFEKNILPYAPTLIIQGARVVTYYRDVNHRKWFIIPYTIPDFGTQLHEIGHDFLDIDCPNYWDYYQSPWFREGVGMYYESGSFDQNGNFTVNTPFQSIYSIFMNRYNSGTLIPLRELTSYNDVAFYTTGDIFQHYAQAMMLVYYVMKVHPSLLVQTFNKIETKEIVNNAQLLNDILTTLTMTIDQLDAAYIRYSTGQCWLGDMNCDGQFNIFDLQRLVNCVFGKGSCANGDLNGDGQYNIFDAQQLVNKIFKS